jgi:hypothetical protein
MDKKCFQVYDLTPLTFSISYVEYDMHCVYGHSRRVNNSFLFQDLKSLNQCQVHKQIFFYYSVHQSKMHYKCTNMRIKYISYNLIVQFTIHTEFE